MHDSTSLSTADFGGLVVAAFESRRCEELARMIEKFGGVARVSPSMRESKLADSRPAVEFAHRVLAGQIDAVIFLTGVGTQMLLEQVERHVDRQRLLDALADIPTLVRGPKPAAVLQKLGITPTLRAPEPNTWREVLSTLDAKLPLANLTVGLQEYGVTNPSLLAGLEARGATVERVRVYEWDLPEDTAPLEANIDRLLAGEVQVAMFTSAQQLNNLLRLAAGRGRADDLKRALRRVVIASIGPTTSERLRDEELPVDIEASHPKMGHLVQDSAAQAAEIIERKARFSTPRALTTPAGLSYALRESPFMKACRGEPTPYTPVWLMRQAGRYMPEYRAVREKTTFLELCRNPQLCSEVMCTAVEFLGVDAAIIFSDLLPILEPMGMELEFVAGDGPVIHNPVRSAEDVNRVIDLESIEALHYVIETVSQTRADLPANIPLIGFAGAPFTLASYAIEGGGSRSYLHTKTLMYRDRGAWDALMQRLVRAITLYLNAQIAAGAQAVQVFDSWVGCLGPEDYRQFVLPHMQALFAGLDRSAPAIHFGTGNPQLLPLMAQAGGDVIGVDWRIELADAWRTVGYDRAVQGNLDPLWLLAPLDALRQQVGRILASTDQRPGHIFNLGHGVLPQTPPAHAKALVEMVHELSAR